MLQQRSDRAPSSGEQVSQSGFLARQTSTWGSPARRLAAVIGVVGAAAVVVGTFLPWLHFQGKNFTGWDLYDVRSAAGENAWFIRGMFTSGDMFFTGLVTLILGSGTAVSSAVLLLAHATSPPRRLWTWSALCLPGMVLADLAFLATVVNVVFTYIGTPSAVRYSLWLVLAGAIVAMVGVGVAASGPSKRAQQRHDRSDEDRQHGPSDLKKTA